VVAPASDLGDFLRARRALVTPEQAGLAVTGRRRSAGLRREELARLAGVSVPYYVRLEQGHNQHPSVQVTEALRPGLRALLASLEDRPAIVAGRYRDVLAATRLAQLLHVGYTPGQNLLRFLFLDSRAQERVIDWDQVAARRSPPCVLTLEFSPAIRVWMN
jgi:transcriptional regulator with XRE-family HTH domain